MSSMFSLFYLQVTEKLNVQFFCLLGIFIIGYFGVVFELAFQTFPVLMHLKGCNSFDVTVLLKFVCIIFTITAGIL